MKLTFHKLVARQKRKVACVLLTVMVSELVLPLRALALTSGPSQPEFQGFTPLATTSLVDPFSGDFSYNIPLLEIDGYPLNLVYRATSNVEEEGSWVGYGWNVNVGTLNRHVRGLPDDMNGDMIKGYQNVRTRELKSNTVSIDASIAANIGKDGIGLTAGAQASVGYTWDDDNYIGKGVGLAVGAGVFANLNAGPFSIGANAGVTLAAHSNNGGSISTYAGFNAGATFNEYVSIGFGKSVNRTFNTISGWEHPNVVGSFNVSNVTFEVQKNFVSSISNQIPQVTQPYYYTSDGIGWRLKLGASVGFLDGLGIDLGLGISLTKSNSKTFYCDSNLHRGYGYMYAENAKPADLLDFTRDNDGGINKDMPFLPPAMKTFDVFSSTAHNASSVFRADRNDFGTVRDPELDFKSTSLRNEMHEVELRLLAARLDCWVGVKIGYNNYRTETEGSVASGGCIDDMVRFRKPGGRDPNLFFRPCGAVSQADEAYLNQVNKYSSYAFKKADSIRGGGTHKRPVITEPIAVFTNEMIEDLPQTVVSKKLRSYAANQFPLTQTAVTEIDRPVNNEIEKSRIGAILNTNREGQTFVYGTPVMNNIKNEVAFRVNGFNTNNYQEWDGLMSFVNDDASQYNGQVRDRLYKNTLTPAYATSYLLNAMLSPDYVDVTNNGITDDDLGSFVRFNYTRAATDYRWRVPYGDSGENKALLNQGVKVTKFDDMGSYVIGSKQLWYAHSMESKNYVVEFYLSPREDARDSRSMIIRPDHPYTVAGFNSDKSTFDHQQKLDSIKYYYKHDRYLNAGNAVPLKTIYFDYDYNISSNVPNSAAGGKLRLTAVRVRHAGEPLEFAERYSFGYSTTNPAYQLGAKDGWGNYYPNNRQLPLPEFPYINQDNQLYKDSIARAFHLTRIGLPSGGNIEVDYEADDYSWVQDKRAMALTEVAGVGASPNLVATDVHGLYDYQRNPYLYIYVKAPPGPPISNLKEFLLNGSGLMYFSFNINIAGDAFSVFDQVKGYAEVEDANYCPNQGDHIYIKVKAVDLTGTSVSPSPMTNTAINMARAFASDQLYFQEQEYPDGHNRNQGDRMGKAVKQVGDAIFGKNSVVELMKDFKAGRWFRKNKSYVRLALAKPKIGGGSRVSELKFDDKWAEMVGSESSSLIGYRYTYKDEDGLSSGVASYEPLLGGEENPMRSGASYKLSNNPSKYPPFDPVELIKEDPAGESFFPTGSVGYGRVTIESIHRDYARSARSRVVHEFYTAKDFPYFSSYGPRQVKEVKDGKYPTPGIRDILLSFMGIEKSFSSSMNRYQMKQSFVIETNDMHGKPKGTYNYRLLLKNGEDELVSYTQYDYHTNGNNRLANEVDVIQHVSTNKTVCSYFEKDFPKDNVKPVKKTMGVEIDVCTDSREVTTTEERKSKVRGGSLKLCIPFPSPKLNISDREHKHTDYFKATVTTKIISRYGILKQVKNYKEGAETIMVNKYYDAVTGQPVVQVYKDKYGDDLYDNKIPAYWTKTDLEPAYLDYPYHGKGTEAILPGTLLFNTAGAGFLGGSNLLQATFTTTEDLFHPGDELFVRAKATNDPGPKWHRLYVTDVQVKKDHYAEPDPLSYRYGGSQTPGATFEVTVTPYRDNTLSAGNDLSFIEATFKYRPGRRNMLTHTAGSYLSLKNPFTLDDSVTIGGVWVAGSGGGPHGDIRIPCKAPSFMNPVIDATASRFEAINAIPGGNKNTLTHNPVSTGLMSQPYVSATYSLYGDRKDQSGTMKQRGNGILRNWYYWLPARYDSTTLFFAPTALLTHWDNAAFNGAALNGGNNAEWFQATQVTKSVPSLGPVEETNPLGIYSAIYPETHTGKVMHVTANGKFGQTWAETFEDLRQLRIYNDVADFVFSPFRKNMQRQAYAGGYEVYKKSQQNLNNGITGSFTLDSLQSHTGLYSVSVGAGAGITVKVTPKKYTGNLSYFLNLFDFNLDAASNQKYTYEVWVRSSNQNNWASPTVNSGGTTTTLARVTNIIDGWALYRANISVSDNALVTLTLPGGTSGQHYDDLRMFPASANVKTYVYHPFRTYLMAILDENNMATYYEYNARNQLVRLKKETEKGVITITENIKNIVAN